MKELINEVKELIIESLNLEDMKPSDIDENAPLFNEGLGLDSVDALELGLAVQKRYGLVLDSKTANLKEIFRSVSSLAKYISENRK
ncbi:MULTISPECIES: phosphopantetheine-binding protein [Campylobacter]|uniref:phosphopantetheine-binding protein n=1 Tax=Campylobacter TaxID=194 RepID=UPI00027A38E4|nr:MULTISPECIES: phosphopantetheine-binding protein [Campylobacter]EJP75695.1 putative acyl carrier protein [Campylobacter sp. FOBRC14]MBN7287369.1 acyl carrier protein [Campylobacter curvus]MDU6826719.1 phosphopantetheine-binding protein [Campylobacter sp.]QKF60774.1 acyl carrier protein [Campylobacter curvus]UEB49096.1 phosphopantetheine-binding protein [Campylobacter curvus]